MTDQYHIGIETDSKHLLSDLPFTTNQLEDFPNGYSYMLISYLHGELDIYHVEYLVDILGSPIMPEKEIKSAFDDLVNACRKRHVLESFIQATLSGGIGVEFIIHDLGSTVKSIIDIPIQRILLRDFLEINYFHENHRFRIDA